MNVKKYFIANSYSGKQEFTFFEELPEKSDLFLTYDLTFSTDEANFVIPFTFEPEYHLKLVNGLFQEMVTDVMTVRFWVDDNSYKINELKDLNKMKIGQNLTIEKTKIMYTREDIQEYKISFTVNCEVLDTFIHLILDTYQQEAKYKSK